jgi:hypothetical protein
MPAQAGAGVPAEAGDPGGDPAPTRVAADPRVVVALVGVQLDRSAALTPATDRAVLGDSSTDDERRGWGSGWAGLWSWP